MFSSITPPNPAPAIPTPTQHQPAPASQNHHAQGKIKQESLSSAEAELDLDKIKNLKPMDRRTRDAMEVVKARRELTRPWLNKMQVR